MSDFQASNRFILRIKTLLGPVLILIVPVILITQILLFVSAADSAVSTMEPRIYFPLVHSISNSEKPRLVNAPYIIIGVREDINQTGIFWFGQVTPTENYADVRVGYDDTDLVIHVNVFDRYLWYDLDPTAGDLINWDSVSLYLNIGGNPGISPSEDAYLFIAQVNHWQPRDEYQAVFQGNDTTWEPAEIPFTTDTSWRGEGLNDTSKPAKGWTAIFTIPFASLGFSTPPHDEVWRLGIALHDRDDSTGTPIPDKIWPESFDPDLPDTWGRLHYGLPGFHSSGTPDGTTVIRNGNNGVTVKDGHVGGEFDCGADVNHFAEWGNTNYEAESASQVNIQNQWDVSDWPCFSKYYISFPLEEIPPESQIISATLTMYHFGDAGAGYTPGPQPSLIQVLTVHDDWDDTTITWNNAPLAYENIGRTNVNPLLSYPGWPGVPVHWDVSRAVDEAHRLGATLHLVLYSADSERHSGKYFFSSNSNSDGSARPTLMVLWKIP